MMGLKVRERTARHTVSLEDLVPADDFYRHLDRVLDLAFVRDLVRDTYAPAGRPSIDSVVFFRTRQHGRQHGAGGAGAWAAGGGGLLNAPQYPPQLPPHGGCAAAPAGRH